MTQMYDYSLPGHALNGHVFFFCERLFSFMLFSFLLFIYYIFVVQEHQTKPASSIVRCRCPPPNQLEERCQLGKRKRTT